jgi:hypothetical protein
MELCVNSSPHAIDGLTCVTVLKSVHTSGFAVRPEGLILPFKDWESRLERWIERPICKRWQRPKP